MQKQSKVVETKKLILNAVLWLLLAISLITVMVLAIMYFWKVG
jgi:hypothetical protein